MNIKMFGMIALAGAVMVSGCDKNAADDDVMAVSVNGVRLMKSEIDADVEKVIEAQNAKRPNPEEQREYFKQQIARQIVRSFIIEKVLVAKAKADGFKVTDEDRKAREEEFMKAVGGRPGAPKSLEEHFKNFPLGEERARSEFENGILIDKMFKDAKAKAPAVDCTAEAQKIVDNIVSNNAAAAETEAAALKKINELKAELDKTPAAELAAKFAELAKANSACPSGKSGGDLGEFTHGMMVKEFDEAAFKLEIGKVSDPVKTQFGYHLIMTTKKIPAVEAKDDAPATPEKVQASHILIKGAETQEVPKIEEVVKFLTQREEQKFVQTFVEDQVKAANIEASEDYKQFLPEDKKTPAPVEKPAEK